MTMAAKDIEIGLKLSETVKTIDQNMIDCYGKLNGDSNTIHYDKEVAQQYGFPDTIAHGLMTFGFLSEVMTLAFGKGWVVGGRINLSFIAPVHPGDTITARGAIKEKAAEGEGVRVTVEIWCENQTGNKVLAGDASALL